MAAASNKPGAVHYALIVFVMISVVLGIVSYMYHREYSDAAAELLTLKKEVSDSKRNVSARVDEVQALKKTIGFMFDLVDDATNPQNANTVKAAALKNMADFGKELAGKDYAESMQKLREALDAALADRDSKAGQVATLERDLKAESDKLNARVDTASKAQSKAESDKRDVISVQDERLKSKQDELDKVKQDNNTLTADLAAEKELAEKTLKSKNNEIAQLENRIELLREKLNDSEKLSFEIADGLVQRVDNSAKLVWINLGSDDFLKPRMTFSVYSKENHGVGRGAEDIKGKIEVTRILGSHISEARILDEDLFRPMVANDLIYTPCVALAWSKRLPSLV
jgi:conjugal transfer/entry exclusion protein